MINLSITDRVGVALSYHRIRPNKLQESDIQRAANRDDFTSLLKAGGFSIKQQAKREIAAALAKDKQETQVNKGQKNKFPHNQSSNAKASAPFRNQNNRAPADFRQNQLQARSRSRSPYQNRQQRNNQRPNRQPAPQPFTQRYSQGYEANAPKSPPPPRIEAAIHNVKASSIVSLSNNPLCSGMKAQSLLSPDSATSTFSTPFNLFSCNDEPLRAADY